MAINFNSFLNKLGEFNRLGEPQGEDNSLEALFDKVLGGGAPAVNPGQTPPIAAPTAPPPEAPWGAPASSSGRDWSRDTRKGLGKVLGDIADTLLMLDGRGPIFAQANQQERMREAAREYGNNPQELARALYAIDYSTGKKAEDDFLDHDLKRRKEGREAFSAGITDSQNVLKNQQKTLALAGQMLRSAKPEAKEAMAEQANALLKKVGIDTISVPKDYDDSFIENMSLTPNEFVTNAERRRANDSLMADRRHQQKIDEGNIVIRGIAEDRDYEVARDRNQVTREGQAETRRKNKAREAAPKKGSLVTLPNGEKVRIK